MVEFMWNNKIYESWKFENPLKTSTKTNNIKTYYSDSIYFIKSSLNIYKIIQIIIFTNLSLNKL